MRLPISYPTLESGDFTDPARIRAVFRAIAQAFQRVSLSFNNPDNGTTADRPTQQLVIGQSYFDTTLGRPIWWDGSNWIEADGTVV